MLVISFLFAILFVKRAAKRFDIPSMVIENLAFYLMLGVIIGGRILYVIFHWAQYENNVLDVFAIWKGGMMFFGGFLGALIASILYLRKAKIAIFSLADIVAPAIALGEFFTRIGCFLNGCCFGTTSSLPWAVTFPAQCVAGSSPIGEFALHPTQIYSSLFGLILFFFLKKKLYKPHSTGEVFSLYLMFSGGFRFGIDFIRYYENSANLWINQIIALGIIIAGVIGFVKATQKKN